MTVADNSAALKIVTVEDSHAIVERLKEIVTRIGGVEFQGNAETFTAAIDLIKAVRPAVVILDINLRSEDGKNGIYLLSMIRKIYPETKFIMLTNLTDIRYRDLCMDFGADYFFDKSNDFDKIPETLNQIIDMKH
jgi:DNA-binding NarL/FixJ family response regulator